MAYRFRNVRVGYEPFIFIECIVNQVQYERVRQWFVCLKHYCDKNQRPRSEWHVGRHGRKAWLKDVAERRGLGVAGKRGRKAWLKGVVLRRACRIEDVGLEVSQKSVCLNKGPAPSVCLNKGPNGSCRQRNKEQKHVGSEINVRGCSAHRGDSLQTR